MKLIFQAFIRCLPSLLVGIACVVIVFIGIGIMAIKVYKDD